MRPACGRGGVSEGIAGGRMIVIWQRHPNSFSASHWHTGTCGADGSPGRDCAKSSLGAQICIPGSSSAVQNLICAPAVPNTHVRQRWQVELHDEQCRWDLLPRGRG